MENLGRISGTLRWAARVLSSLYLAFFLSMLVGDVLLGEETSPLTSREGLGFLFVAILFAGYILPWKWEVWGGALGIAATAAFGVAINTLVLLLLTVAAPGLLYLSSAALSRHRS